MAENAKPSVEIELVSKVKNCRKCKWFWGKTEPYGPYPTYRYTVGSQKQKDEHSKAVEATGYGALMPAIMHGCRKAPIMTIGINPNLPAYFPGAEGAARSYPHFEDEESYAHYYRYKTIHQEHFDIASIREAIIPDSAIHAEADGQLVKVNRSVEHRWMELVFEYEGKNGGDKETKVIELTWKPRARSVVLVESPRYKPVDVKAGELIAGTLDAPAGKQLALFKEDERYYTRFVPVLEAFKEKVGGILKDAKLQIGEDVAMHDMIACASPGWNNYDIPKERVIANCITHNRFVTSQFLQSQPKVVVIVGQTSLDMFVRTMRPYIKNLDYEIEDTSSKKPRTKDIFHLLYETTKRKCYVDIDNDGVRFKSRLLTVPHFSYRDNYTPHARLSNRAWEAFANDMEEDAHLLLAADRVEENYSGLVQTVRVWEGEDRDGNEDRILPILSGAAQRLLMANYYDPTEMLANALVEEFNNGELAFDPQTKRLVRAPGACNFCVNDRWSFEEGCEYGKADATA